MQDMEKKITDMQLSSSISINGKIDPHFNWLSVSSESYRLIRGADSETSSFSYITLGGQQFLTI